MRKTILLSLATFALLFLCYRLLFIVLDVTAIFMASDADINIAGKVFLFVAPVIIIAGVWAAYRYCRISEGSLGYSDSIVLLLSAFGGLFGVIAIDLLFHAPGLSMENYLLVVFTLALSFIVFSFLTFVGVRKHLTRRLKGTGR